MSFDSAEKMSLDDFKRWKVPELKNYLRNRGLKTTGTKEELTALAFGAEQFSVPLKLTAKQEAMAKAEQYKVLLHCRGKQLPDPFVELDESSWVRESEGMEKWPPIFQLQIAEFLLSAENGTTLGKRLLSDYKEGKAYSYFDSQWLREILYHEISHELCFLKSESTPSQSINNVPHKIWVCVDRKTGTVQSAYCTCFAGLGSTCNHVAAVLFKVEHAWMNGLTLGESPTSKECAWNKYGAKKKKITPREVAKMEWKKPHYHKKGKPNVINPIARQLFKTTKPSIRNAVREPCLKDIVSALYANTPSACLFHYADIPVTNEYPPEADLNVEKCIDVETTPNIPPSITDLVSSADTVDELRVAINAIKTKEIELLEESTQGQSDNQLWSAQRIGRITASNIHRVMTKVNSLQRKPDTASAIPLVRSLTGQSSSIPTQCIPSLKYSRQLEEEARTRYVNEMKLQKHKDIQVKSCGLFLLQDKAYIGASPDGLVSCSCCGKGLLEIKCPFSIANQSPCEANLPYLKKDGSQDVRLVPNHPYFSQMQAQMGVLGRKWCDFFVYTRHGFHMERIMFQDEVWLKLLKAADYFFANYLAPELLSMKPSCSAVPSHSAQEECEDHPEL